MLKLNALSDRVLSLLRIVTALLFMSHGFVKFLHFPMPPEKLPLPPLITVAGYLEIVGGILLLLGLYTRAAAFICSGAMAFAYFMVHFQKNFFPVSNGGDAAIMFCFVFFYLVFAGPGPFSLDGLIGKKRRPE